tara:strand:+ start:432 stop:683 length:252 start_codon:yes stop_codon:yes gene_type:complete
MFRKKAINTNMIIPPPTPMEKKAIFHEAPVIRTLTTIAITAGPSPCEAWRNPIPYPKWVLNQYEAVVIMGTLKQALATPKNNP